ncbi:MAG TPA: hypothetical protein VG474_07630 [Solirubrobacteraceae bacterium]|nr:hypothetical protein [Solirubrobacteraceae bacterium]
MADDQRLRLDIALQPSASTIRGTIDTAGAEAVEGRRRAAGATPTG